MKKKILKISIFVIFILGISYSLFEISKSRSFQFFGGLVSQVETDMKVIALTFDDGPGVNTDSILDILREEDVKATFYLTGREIEEYYTEAVKVVQDGHEIGNHSYSHERMVLKSPAFIRDEIETTDQLIREIGYTGDIHFRPPFGKRLLYLPYYLSKQERKTILWNIEPETYPDIAADSNKITEHVVENVKPGSIILLHVMYESRKESLEAVQSIIRELKDEGYTFVTVSELLSLNE